MPTDVFRIPTGFHIIAQGCGTPLPWVSDVFPSLFSTPTELRRFSNTVPQLTQPRWGKRELGRFPTQGSGVPQPWAMFLNPGGILNSNIRFSPLLFIAKKMWVMTRVQLGNERQGGARGMEMLMLEQEAIMVVTSCHSLQSRRRRRLPSWEWLWLFCLHPWRQCPPYPGR